MSWGGIGGGYLDLMLLDLDFLSHRWGKKSIHPEGLQTAEVLQRGRFILPRGGYVSTFFHLGQTGENPRPARGAFLPKAMADTDTHEVQVVPAMQL